MRPQKLKYSFTSHTLLAPFSGGYVTYSHTIRTIRTIRTPKFMPDQAMLVLHELPFCGLSEAIQVKLDRVCNYRLWLIRHMAIRKTLAFLFYYYFIN